MVESHAADMVQLVPAGILAVPVGQLVVAVLAEIIFFQGNKGKITNRDDACRGILADSGQPLLVLWIFQAGRVAEYRKLLQVNVVQPGQFKQDTLCGCFKILMVAYMVARKGQVLENKLLPVRGMQMPLKKQDFQAFQIVAQDDTVDRYMIIEIGIHQVRVFFTLFRSQDKIIDIWCITGKKMQTIFF